MEENSYGDAPFKPNWLAIFAIIIGLIAVGWLAGRLAAAPDGSSLDCPNEDWVQIIQSENHIVVYCEPPASN